MPAGPWPCSGKTIPSTKPRARWCEESARAPASIPACSATRPCAMTRRWSDVWCGPAPTSRRWIGTGWRAGHDDPRVGQLPGRLRRDRSAAAGRDPARRLRGHRRDADRGGSEVTGARRRWRPGAGGAASAPRTRSGL